MSPEKKISVVIPHGGTVGLLEHQLRALAGQTLPPDEIIVSCNRSGGLDALTERLRGSEFEQLPLTLIDSSLVPGPSAARNVGWKASHGDIVLFCDDDDEAAPTWAAELAQSLHDHELSGGPLSYERLNNRRAALRSGHASRSAPTKFSHLPYAPSSNFGVHRSVLEAVSGFDESTACAEDIDLCWRAQYAGFSFAFTPEAVMHYRLRDGFRAAFRQSYQYGLSDGWLLVKHREHGVRRTLRGGLVELAGIPLALWRAITGRGDLVDVYQRIGGLFGRIAATVRYRTWAV